MNNINIRPIEKMETYKELRKKDLDVFLKRFSLDSNQVIRNCPACDVRNNIFLFEKEGFKFVRCTYCECIFVNPCPSMDLLSFYYDQSKSMNFFHDEVLKKTISLRNKVFKERATYLSNFLKKGSHIIEVGSSLGLFVEQALNQGFLIDGVEINTALSDFVKNKYGIKIFNDFFENVEFTSQYDAIVSWEVIEHVINPFEFLKKCTTILKKEGHVIMSLPNIDGIEFKVCGIQHEIIEAPGHINYFSPKTIKILLERAGFTVEAITTPGTLDFNNILNQISLSQTKEDVGSLFLKSIIELANEEERDDINRIFTSIIQKKKVSGHMIVIASLP
jgi:2-polyprenyl-3-methyl-5-hydroxy-6-metoxy-1,4-benzoquinol methylase